MTRPGEINRLPKNLRANLHPIGNNGSYTIPLVATAKREQGHAFPIRRLISQHSLVQLYSGKGSSLAIYKQKYKYYTCTQQCESLGHGDTLGYYTQKIYHDFNRTNNALNIHTLPPLP
jgi:hypothetical protein